MTITTPNSHSGQFAIVPAWAIEHPDIGPAALRVLCILSTYADKEGWCWPRIKTIACRISVSRQAVKRQIKILKDAGIVRVVERLRPDGSNESNKYQIMMMPPENYTAVVENDPGYGGSPDDQSGETDGLLWGGRPVSAPPATSGSHRTHQSMNVPKEQPREADLDKSAMNLLQIIKREYPPEGHPSSDKENLRALEHALSSGSDPNSILIGAGRYQEHCEARNLSPRFTKSLKRFLYDKGYLVDYDLLDEQETASG